MSMYQHTSVYKALEFDTWGIVHAALKTKNGVPHSSDEMRNSCLLAHNYVGQVAKLLDKPRTGWTIPERRIDANFQETIWAHLIKVSLGVWYLVEGLMVWHRLRWENPSAELTELYAHIWRRLHLVRKGFFHDFSEWGHHKDYRPGELTKQEKLRRETGALEEYRDIEGDDYPLQVFLTIKEPTFENRILENIDKTDPAIMALNYQKELPESEVSEFFQSSFDKMSIPLMREVLETLILYRDDYSLDMFFQFLILLQNGGDVGKWRRVMEHSSR